MNDINFAGMNLEKENQFSAPFKKEDVSGTDFPLFPSFFHIFPHPLEGDIRRPGQKKSVNFREIS